MKKFDQKLELGKESIANLSKRNMADTKGGVQLTLSYPCEPPLPTANNGCVTGHIKCADHIGFD